MFTSKFVFVWAIDLVFGDAVNINGFLGIFVVVLVVTVGHRLAEWVFIRLGRSSMPDEPSRKGVERPAEGGFSAFR
jgi:high-affinity Fe2+/Pb2+ permease